EDREEAILGAVLREESLALDIVCRAELFEVLQLDAELLLRDEERLALLGDDVVRRLGCFAPRLADDAAAALPLGLLRAEVVAERGDAGGGQAAFPQEFVGRHLRFHLLEEHDDPAIGISAAGAHGDLAPDRLAPA